MSKIADSAAFQKGVRASIAWLHAKALEMNDPHARTVLNTAAYHLGLDKPTTLLAAPQPPAPVTWRGIESAPRDGTHIMVWDKHGVTTAHWCICQDCWAEVPSNNDERCKYTHWMPLPETPHD